MYASNSASPRSSSPVAAASSSSPRACENETPGNQDSRRCREVREGCGRERREKERRLLGGSEPVLLALTSGVGSARASAASGCAALKNDPSNELAAAAAAIASATASDATVNSSCCGAAVSRRVELGPCGGWVGLELGRLPRIGGVWVGRCQSTAEVTPAARVGECRSPPPPLPASPPRWAPRPPPLQSPRQALHLAVSWAGLPPRWWVRETPPALQAGEQAPAAARGWACSCQPSSFASSSARRLIWRRGLGRAEVWAPQRLRRQALGWVRVQALG